jgi:hypothetical protein
MSHDLLQKLDSLFHGKPKRPQDKNSVLTLYLPLKQDSASQSQATAIVNQFRPGVILDPSTKTHFFRVVSIPLNQSNLAGIVISCIFDGVDLNAYLATLWNLTIKGVPFQTAWAGLFTIISNPPASATSLTDFQTYAAANNLNTQSDLSYGYEATTADIIPAFPVAISPQINPLSLYVPFKQGFPAQAILRILANGLNGKVLPTNTLIHFAMVALIPNPPESKNPDRKAGLLLITCFDGAMNPYLDFFWGLQGARDIWAGIVTLATNTPDSLKEKLEWMKSGQQFEDYINANDRAQDGDLSGSYTASLPDIYRQFPLPPVPGT